MTAGNRDPAVRCQNPGTDPLSIRNLISQAGIKIPQAADCPDRGHAAHQLRLRKSCHYTVSYRAGKCTPHQLLRQCLIIPLLLLRLAVPCQMYMHIDKSRHQISALQIDHLTTGRNLIRRNQTGNLIALRQDTEPFLHLHIPGAVQDLPICVCVFFHTVSLLPF